MKVRKLAYALGAEVLDVDITKPLDDETIRAIRAAWLENLVLVFRGREITHERHIAFSRYFGELELHQNKFNRHGDYPELYVVTNKPRSDGKPSDTRNAGRVWHSDGAYKLKPSMGSLLYSMEIPPVGGDTLFTNMYMAYDTLSETMKKFIDPLFAINDRSAGKTDAIRDPNHVAERLKLAPPVLNPVVRVHPESGRKALFVSSHVTTGIDGMKPEESRAILEFLFAHSVKQEFIFRHHWQLHDLVMWDNRCTMHLAPADFDTRHPRYMVRTTLNGTPLGRPYEPQNKQEESMA